MSKKILTFFYRSIIECIARFLPLGNYTAFAYDKTTSNCTSGFKDFILAPLDMDKTQTTLIYTVSEPYTGSPFVGELCIGP